MISSKLMHTVDQTIKSKEVKEMITSPSLMNLEMLLAAKMTFMVMKAMISSKVALEWTIFKVDLAMMKLMEEKETMKSMAVRVTTSSKQVAMLLVA